MKKMPKKRKNHLILFKQILKFNLVGVLNTLVDFGLFTLLYFLGNDYLAAQFVSYIGGTANSYVFNKYWTFEHRGGNPVNKKEMIRFLAINACSLGTSLLLLYLFHDILSLPVLFSKVLATGMTLILNFAGYKLWVFKPLS